MDHRPHEDESIERDLVYLGLVGIIDPPRAEVRQAIGEAHHAGIRVVMITGDHPKTAARIASDLGIVDEPARVVSGRELEETGDEDLRRLSRDAAVYARVAPEHKLRIVTALQGNGADRLDDRRRC